jgi:hypothetical protein
MDLSRYGVRFGTERAGQTLVSRDLHRRTCSGARGLGVGLACRSEAASLLYQIGTSLPAGWRPVILRVQDSHMFINDEMLSILVDF